MNKLILAIILVLLLIPSMVLAEEQQYTPLSDEDHERIGKNTDDYNVAYEIGLDIFKDVYKKDGVNHRLSAILRAYGYKNLSGKVLEDLSDFGSDYYIDLFYKHNAKHKYHIGNEEMFFLSILCLEGILHGYRLGFLEVLSQFPEINMADIAPKMYEKYLEDKKKEQLKQKDDQTNSKGD